MIHSHIEASELALTYTELPSWTVSVPEPVLHAHSTTYILSPTFWPHVSYPQQGRVATSLLTTSPLMRGDGAL